MSEFTFWNIHSTNHQKMMGNLISGGQEWRPRLWREAVMGAGMGWPASGGQAKESADGAEGANGDETGQPARQEW